MPEEKEHTPLAPLRSYELRLLSCTLPPPPSSVKSSNHALPLPVPSANHQTTSCSDYDLHSLIEAVLTSIESGDYFKTLSSDACRSIFKFAFNDEASFHEISPNRFYSEVVVKSATSFITGEDNDDDGNDRRSYGAFLVMMIAVAAFLSFTQCNFTGPAKRLPLMPLMGALGLKEEEKVPGGGWLEWEAWARNELMLAGSDIRGKISNLQYIVFAKNLLLMIKDLSSEGSFITMHESKSISWWLVRLVFYQQKILEDSSSSLFVLLEVYMSESLLLFDTLENVQVYWGANLRRKEAIIMVSMLHLEVGIIELAYGRVDSARVHFETAESASSLQLSLSGALGYRTVHQVEPKAQPLLVSDTSARNGGDTSNSVDVNCQENVPTLSEDCLHGQDREVCEASDVLMTPIFVEDGRDSATRTEGGQNDFVANLTDVQQALVLAKCFSIEKNSRQEDLQRWEMAPYIETVNSQKSSCYIIQFFRDILRIRSESKRSHTKERALLMMEKLFQHIADPSPGVAERIHVCYGVHIPWIPELRREHGNLLVSCGLIGEAVKVYEDLELWDKVIVCYSLLEKKAAAVELIKRRLSESPNDPKLWCFRGDVTNDDSCYEKSLEVSENKSARAKRSLARSACNKGAFEKSKQLWLSALAMNSLYPEDGWFSLGYVAFKGRDFHTSLDAFTRAVQLDPEKGTLGLTLLLSVMEPPNSHILSAHLNGHITKNKNKEAFIALKEALKFKRNSWKLWEYYSNVAADINNLPQAMEGVKKVLDMTGNKSTNYAILERTMQEIEKQKSQIKSSMTNNHHNGSNICCKCDDSHDDCQLTYSDDGLPRPHIDERLVELLGNVLQQIEKSGGGAETLGLSARWYKVKGDLTKCAEKCIKQVRAYQGSDLWHDGDRFKKFAHASLELCNVYMELSASTDNQEELIKAEKHLKHILKQAQHFSFPETEEVRSLQGCLKEVEQRIQTSNLVVGQ